MSSRLISEVFHQCSESCVKTLLILVRKCTAWTSKILWKKARGSSGVLQKFFVFGQKLFCLSLTYKPSGQMFPRVIGSFSDTIQIVPHVWLPKSLGDCPEALVAYLENSSYLEHNLGDMFNRSSELGPTALWVGSESSLNLVQKASVFTPEVALIWLISTFTNLGILCT